MWMKTPNKKQSGPAWLDSLETTSIGTSPRPTTSWAGNGVASTNSRRSPTPGSPPERRADSPRKQWLIKTSFNEGDLVAGARITQWNVVRLRRIANHFSLSRNETEILGR